MQHLDDIEFCFRFWNWRTCDKNQSKYCPATNSYNIFYFRSIMNTMGSVLISPPVSRIKKHLSQYFPHWYSVQDIIVILLAATM